MTLHLFKVLSNISVDLATSLKQQMIINIDLSSWIGLLVLYLILSLTLTAISIFAQSVGRIIVKN